MSRRDLLSLARLLSSTQRHAFDRSGQLYFFFSFFFFLRAGSQIAGEQPLTPTVLLVYVELISLTNIVPLFHFSRSAFAKLFLRRFGSLKTTV